jgi:hypothetical protein
MRTNFLNDFFQPFGLTADQVVEKLTSEIDLLHGWLINCGEDYTSKVFNEKLQLLRDKIEEREKFEKILALESNGEIN